LLVSGRRQHQLKKDRTLELLDGVHDDATLVPALRSPLRLDPAGSLNRNTK
jgi:hypothetical protein